MLRTLTTALLTFLFAGCYASHLTVGDSPSSDLGLGVDSGPADLDAGTVDMGVGTDWVGDCSDSSNVFRVAGDAADRISGGNRNIGPDGDLNCGEYGDGKVSCGGWGHGIGVGPEMIWGFAFRAADGRPLEPGLYPDATIVFPATEGLPGLDISAFDATGATEARCTTLTGSFTVHEIARGPTMLVTPLTRFRATFEAHCDGSPARVVGCVSLRRFMP
jgi:hypothetical protein